MDKNSLNTNKQFMIGNGMLAFGVFAVIIIFLYMSFRFQRKADKVQTYEGVYNIELTNSFAGDSIAVYLNEREFEIKSKNSKLSVIDKLYVNGGLFFKKAVCRDSRQGVGYKVTE